MKTFLQFCQLCLSEPLPLELEIVSFVKNNNYFTVVIQYTDSKTSRCWNVQLYYYYDRFMSHSKNDVNKSGLQSFVTLTQANEISKELNMLLAFIATYVCFSLIVAVVSVKAALQNGFIKESVDTLKKRKAVQYDKYRVLYGEDYTNNIFFISMIISVGCISFVFWPIVILQSVINYFKK